MNTIAHVSFKGCTAGPCPKCGSNGIIPDGDYTNIGDQIFALLNNISEPTVLVKFHALLQNQIQTGKSPDEIRQSLNKDIPEIRSLTDLIPKTRADAYAFIGIMLALLTLVVASFQALKSEGPQINVSSKQQIINQTFENYYFHLDSVKNYVQKGKSDSTDRHRSPNPGNKK